jgi:hypothetical protein
MERRASLPRPPRVPPALQEFPAVVEPPLRDIDDPPETLIEGFELVESQSPRVAVPATTEMADPFREAVFADERIQRLLVDKRHAVLGASRLLDDKEREVPASLLLLYSYTDERTYRVWLEGEGGDVRVRDIEELDQQPPASEEEIQRAIDIARTADDVESRLAEGFEATALLASSVEPGDRHYGRRRVAVGFGPPDERLPRVRVLVDLGTEEVLAVDFRSDGLEEGQR